MVRQQPRRRNRKAGAAGLKSWRLNDDVGATLVVALLPMDGLHVRLGPRGARSGRPQGSPLQQGMWRTPLPGLTSRVQPSLVNTVSTRFIFLKQGLVAVAAHPEHLLKEEIVGNLDDSAAVLADDDEHQINVDHPPAEILGQHLNGVAETEGAPEGDKK